MKYQIWFGAMNDARQTLNMDCLNDVDWEDLPYEMMQCLHKANHIAAEDVEDGGDHYRPYIEVVREIDSDFTPTGEMS